MPFLLDNLTHYVKFDDNFLDSSINGYHGAPVNSPTFAPGRINNGANFVNASSQSVTFGTALPIGNAQRFSMGGFCNPSIIGGFRTLAIKGAAVATSRTFGSSGGAGAAGNSAIMFGLANGANTYGYTGLNKLVVGVWSHVGITFDGTFNDADLTVQNNGRIKIYWNGVLQALTFSGAIPTATALNAADDFRIGGGGSAGWDGVIDEWAVWINRVLTLADWQEVYNAGAGKPFGTWSSSPRGSSDMDLSVSLNL